MLKSFSIQGASIEEMISKVQNNSSMEIKYAKAIFGMPDTLECKRNGFWTCPSITKVSIVSVSNTVGTRFHLTQGTEKVNFKYGAIKGSFVHMSGRLVCATMNYTRKSELTLTLVEIAVYIGWKVQETKSNTYQKCMEEIRRMTYRNPHSLISCSESVYDRIKHTEEPMVYGNLTLTDNTEYSYSGIISLSLDLNKNLKLHGTGQIVEITIKKENLSCYSDEIMCSSSRMAKYFSFKRMVKNRFHLFFTE